MDQVQEISRANDILNDPSCGVFRGMCAVDGEHHVSREREIARFAWVKFRELSLASHEGA